MKKYRVVETIKNIVFEDLNYDEAHQCMATLVDSARQGLEVEEYEWLPQEAKRLGRDPDLH